MGRRCGILGAQCPRRVGNPGGRTAFAIVEERIIHAGWRNNLNLVSQSQHTVRSHDRQAVIVPGLRAQRDVGGIRRGERADFRDEIRRAYVHARRQAPVKAVCGKRRRGRGRPGQLGRRAIGLCAGQRDWLRCAGNAHIVDIPAIHDHRVIRHEMPPDFDGARIGIRRQIQLLALPAHLIAAEAGDRWHDPRHTAVG